MAQDMVNAYKVSPIIFELVTVRLGAELRNPILGELLRLQEIIEALNEHIDCLEHQANDSCGCV